jgi:hypothetical protein
MYDRDRFEMSGDGCLTSIYYIHYAITPLHHQSKPDIIRRAEIRRMEPNVHARVHSITLFLRFGRTDSLILITSHDYPTLVVFTTGSKHAHWQYELSGSIHQTRESGGNATSVLGTSTYCILLMRLVPTNPIGQL